MAEELKNELGSTPIKGSTSADYQALMTDMNKGTAIGHLNTVENLSDPVRAHVTEAIQSLPDGAKLRPEAVTRIAEDASSEMGKYADWNKTHGNFAGADGKMPSTAEALVSESEKVRTAAIEAEKNRPIDPDAVKGWYNKPANGAAESVSWQEQRELDFANQGASAKPAIKGSVAADYEGLGNGELTKSGAIDRIKKMENLDGRAAGHVTNAIESLPEGATIHPEALKKVTEDAAGEIGKYEHWDKTHGNFAGADGKMPTTAEALVNETEKLRTPAVAVKQPGVLVEEGHAVAAPGTEHAAPVVEQPAATTGEQGGQKPKTPTKTPTKTPVKPGAGAGAGAALEEDGKKAVKTLTEEGKNAKGWVAKALRGAHNNAKATLAIAAGATAASLLIPNSKKEVTQENGETTTESHMGTGKKLLFGTGAVVTLLAAANLLSKKGLTANLVNKIGKDQLAKIGKAAEKVATHL